MIIQLICALTTTRTYPLVAGIEVEDSGLMPTAKCLEEGKEIYGAMGIYSINADEIEAISADIQKLRELDLDKVSTGMPDDILKEHHTSYVKLLDDLLADVPVGKGITVDGVQELYNKLSLRAFATEKLGTDELSDLMVMECLEANLDEAKAYFAEVVKPALNGIGYVRAMTAISALIDSEPQSVLVFTAINSMLSETGQPMTEKQLDSLAQLHSDTSGEMTLAIAELMGVDLSAVWVDSIPDIIAKYAFGKA